MHAEKNKGAIAAVPDYTQLQFNWVLYVGWQYTNGETEFISLGVKEIVNIKGQ